MPQGFPPYTWAVGDKISIIYYLQLASKPGMQRISKTIVLKMIQRHPHYILTDNDGGEWKLEIQYCHNAIIIDPNGKKYFVDPSLFNRGGIYGNE